MPLYTYAQNSHASRLGARNLLTDMLIGMSAIKTGNICVRGAMTTDSVHGSSATLQCLEMHMEAVLR